jgi:hypothetical protein
LPGEVTFRVVAPNGHPLPFGARINRGRPDRADYVSVRPWNGVGRRFDLRPYFRLDRAGRYTVTATYTGGASGGDPPAGLWTGTLNSNPITVELG